MTILLVGPDFEENLSIRYLSGSLRAAGYDTHLAPFNSLADTGAVALTAQGADIVGLSMCFQSRAKEFLGLAQLIKLRDARKLVVAGGHYASCAAEELLAHHPEIDLIVIHEGEQAIVEIADAATHLEDRLPQIAGIAYRGADGRVHRTRPRPMIDDLDSLPFPDRRGPVHTIAGVPTSYIMGSRGCYEHCAYCCITTLHELAPGKRFRQRTVQNIADEMAMLYCQRGTRQFVFHDDNFLVPSTSLNHTRLAALEAALDERRIGKIALVIKCRPADANPAVLRRLKKMGLVRVFLGVESSTERGLSTLDRKQSVEQSVRALETCAELDISAQFTMMVFNPDATLSTLRSDVAFMRRFYRNPLNFCRTEIYAGTPLEKRMLALGRARGNYLARAYDLSDSVADLACRVSLDLFDTRCWSNASLMQRAIGLDHKSAVLKRLYDGPQHAQLSHRIAAWLRSVNLDTVTLLEEVIELCASGRQSAAFERTLLSLKERERVSRQEFLSHWLNLATEIDALQFTAKESQVALSPPSRSRLARQVAAAVLAIGMPATPELQQALAQQVKTPPSASASGQESLCSLSGTITDPSGAVIAGAKITITNSTTGVGRSLTTNSSGNYEANDLPSGTYGVTVEVRGFKTARITGVVLKTGDRQKKDVALQIGMNIGCCEYAASPMHVEDTDWISKKKPFTYYVGVAKNDDTFQQIAKIVYGDRRKWVQIFEANRDVAQKPESLSYGTAITIPARRRPIPKLQSKLLPAYPPEARKEHVFGDVVMDVSLKPDGTVADVTVIEGNPLLAKAAADGVLQWRYLPPQAKQHEASTFVVVISFDKRGKVHWE